VIEVNGTPQFRGIHEATGLDMAVPIVEHALALARRAADGERARLGA
jgi:glutathione synthase/RimK-type ligase-like ATP-grasp enzyme